MCTGLNPHLSPSLQDVNALQQAGVALDLVSALCDGQNRKLQATMKDQEQSVMVRKRGRCSDSVFPAFVRVLMSLVVLQHCWRHWLRYHYSQFLQMK